MSNFPQILLFVSFWLILFVILWNRLYYQKRHIIWEKPLFPPVPITLTIAPHVKHALSFRVPRSIRSDESCEVVVEYFQGITYFFFEGVNSFLYETLEVLPRSLPNGLRGLFFSASNDTEVQTQLNRDFLIKLTSSKIQIAPDGPQIRKKGDKIPCKWRWDISCNQNGKYNLVFDFDETLKEYFPDNTIQSSQVLFQVKVRSSTGLFLQSINAVKKFIVGLALFLAAIATIIMAIPSLQSYISGLLAPWLPH